MTMGHVKPFGLRDIKITNILGTTQVDLPSSQVMTVKPLFSSGKMMGDDGVQSLVSYIIGAEWSLESGGIPLSALAIMTGQGTTLTGTTPHQALSWTLAAGDIMPYFKIYGQAIAEDGDDVHAKLFKCKLTSPPEGSFKGEDFFAQKCSGIAIDDGVNGVLEFVQNETADDLPTT
jgi:hypothetical protein